MSTPIADLHCHYPMHLPEAASEPDRSVRGRPFAAMRSFHPDLPLPRRLRIRAALAARRELLDEGPADWWHRHDEYEEATPGATT